MSATLITPAAKNRPASKSMHTTLKNSIVALLGACLTTVADADEPPFNAGFVAVPPSQQTPPFGIWYPSISRETAGKLGPFRPTWAWQGDAADGTFAVVIFSHGHTGRYRNHRQTAATLARNGYIVVAPDHLHDRRLTAKQKMPAMVERRGDELKLALSAVAAHPVVAPAVAPNRVGAVGYSLGTLTALYTAGVTPNLARMREHCQANRNQDPGFCGVTAPLGLQRVIQFALSRLRAIADDAPTEFVAIEAPIKFDAIALVAPIGVPFPAAELRRNIAPVALFRLGQDEQLRHPHHAEYMHPLLPDNPVYKTFADAHHYAFISPFPQWLLDEEDIPVAVDPEGFDRPQFISAINGDIVAFLNRHLK